MQPVEFDNQFDVLFNNITSNQAPGLNTYEKCVLLTKAQDEIVKNYFTANSKGNNIGQGFDDSIKRQADFSGLMKTIQWNEEDVDLHLVVIDSRSHLLKFPEDAFIILNEVVSYNEKTFQVIPLRYDEYTRLMSKPFKRPLKHQAWRLINSGTVSNETYTKCVEIITAPEYDDKYLYYTLRYIRKPKPIIIGDLDGLTIDGYYYTNTDPALTDKKETEGCELDPMLHEDILQRAVELAKIAWTSTGQDNAQMVLAAGQRSE